MSRFPRVLRRRVRGLCARSSPYADLTCTHPAAAIAIASGNYPRIAREKALALVEAGRPLVEVSAALGLAHGMRRLPPEAFRSPADLAPIALGSKGEARAGQLIPDDPAEAAAWLSWLRRSCAAADSELALWLAGWDLCWELDFPEGGPELLGAFAWLSRHRRDTLQLLGVKPFSTAMGFDAAISALGMFALALRIGSALGDTEIADTWLSGGEVDGFEFVALRSIRQLRAEAIAMRNCALSYAEPIAENRCRLFSVRRRGGPVATLEVRPLASEKRVPYIVQLRGIANAPAGPVVWRAALRWLAGQPELSLPELPEDLSAVGPDEGFWLGLLGPYLEAKGPSAILPLRPTRATLRQIEKTCEGLRLLASC